MGPDDRTAHHDELFSAAYDELRRLAHGLKRRRGNTTLNATALVHEAYLKLARAERFRAESPEHLKYTVVRAMKHVLVDAARRQAAASRGGNGVASLRRVALEDSTAQATSVDPHEVLAVAFALDDLAQQSDVQVRAFEFQFFGGLQVVEIAEVMGVSEKRVQRLLRMARAHLAVALTKGPARVRGHA
jgi:RNA polymerase sigma factor (TIGR02999 family)